MKSEIKDSFCIIKCTELILLKIKIITCNGKVNSTGIRQGNISVLTWSGVMGPDLLTA